MKLNSFLLMSPYLNMTFLKHCFPMCFHGLLPHIFRSVLCHLHREAFPDNPSWYSTPVTISTPLYYSTCHYLTLYCISKHLSVYIQSLPLKLKLWESWEILCIPSALEPWLACVGLNEELFTEWMIGFKILNPLNDDTLVLFFHDHGRNICFL